MVSIKVMSTPIVKDILNKYDVNKLLTTILQDYTIHSKALETYLNKIDTAQVIQIQLELSDDSFTYLKGLSSNHNTTPSNILNYLIEMVADCSKIQSKQVSHALDSYYYMFAEASNRNSTHRDYYVSLFKKFSELYELYYYEFDAPVTLSDERIAMFLTLSSDGQALVREIEKQRD